VKIFSKIGETGGNLMRRELLKGTLLISLFLISAFLPMYNALVSAQYPTIKIGVLLDVGVTEGLALQGAIKVADWWFNGPGGGIVIKGVRYNIQFITANEHAAEGRPDLAAQEAEKLITEYGVDFLVGTSLSECGRAVEEVCADYQKIFIHPGCVDDDLIDCGTGTCGHCVRCDYNRYKYIFRLAVNSTTIGLAAFTYLRYLIETKLVKMYGSPVKTAVLFEDLDWTEAPYNYIVYGGALGPNAQIVYHARTPFTCTDFSSYLNGIKASGAHLVVVLYYLPNSITLVRQFYEYPGHIPALMAGVIVPAQVQEFWDQTLGECEYVITLNSAGGRTPIVTEPVPITTIEFYDKFVELNGYTPAWNAYTFFNIIHVLKQVLEVAGIDPPFDAAKSSALIPYIEKYEGLGILGKYKFTGPHPMDPSQYPYLNINPTMKGTLHDTFMNEIGPTWTQGYARPFVLQWIGRNRIVVEPIDQSYSRKTRIPPWMYELADVDIDFNGIVDIFDIVQLAIAFGSVPGDSNWNIEADVNCDGLIDIFDIVQIALKFGSQAPQWPLP
jgi:ABC-type branched-subunit amino acid transport system substrate-binding protein